MKKCYILLILLLFGMTIKCLAQNENEAKASDKLDTLQINRLAVNLDLLFYLTKDELPKYSDLKYINSAQAQYVLKSTEFDLLFRQIEERLNSGYLYYNNYLNISSGLFKYKSLQSNNLLARIFYPTFVFIYQSNSERGLSKRFQTGVFFMPVKHYRPKFKIDFGFGVLRDWSSWEVNNSAKIAACPPEMQDKILFINSHTKLRNDLYWDYSEWRPTLYLNLGYQMNDVLSLSLFSSYQQSVVSPFNKEITAVYPELKKVYPYTYSQLSIGAKVYKGLTLKMSFIYDYENNNLSLYDSSWEYSAIVGVSWSFNGNKYLPVTYKAKNKTDR